MSKNIDDKFCENLMARLDNAKEWVTDSGSYKPLHNFLVAIASRAEKLLLDNGNSITMNEDKTKLLIDSGLKNVFGLNIIMCFYYTNGRVHSPIILDSRRDIIKHGFSEESMPTKIRYYNTKDELIFCVKMEEFDLEDTTRLRHILEERIDRFPEECRSLPLDQLCVHLRASIAKAVNECQDDYRYVPAMYNLRRDKIQYLLPFYMDFSYGKPILAIVVDKDSTYYYVKTVLTLDEAYNNARLLSSQQTWLAR